MTKENIFHAASSQLHRGVNLVEASAGTGKTFAIAMLVLRFVVEKEIPLEQILIVTFTNAATKELRGRIRQRLVEARKILELEGNEKKDQFDQPLQEWSAKFTEPKKRDHARLLLQRGLYSIDQAPVFTIHGFCQRMLGEQALESGQSFDCELLTDLTPLMEEIAQDYWRCIFYGERTVITEILFRDKRFANPGALLESVNRIGVENNFSPQDGSGKDLAACKKRVEQHCKKIRRWWRNNGDSFYQKIITAEEEKYLKKPFPIWSGWADWADRLKTWCCNEKEYFFPNPEFLVKENFMEILSGTRLRTKEKKEEFLSHWPFYASGSPGKDFLEQLGNLVLLHRVAFAHFLQKEMTLRLGRQGTMGFDSLIGNLANVLERESGGHLQTILAGRFKTALIDEFQDTDGKQYSIFSKLFGDGTHFLYLIGDPKQAIYSFRGADIHSYFVAREASKKRLTLDTNYRSHPLLIEEINRLFSGRGNPFFYSEEKLPFSPANARKENECAQLWSSDGEPANGMMYWMLPPNTTKDKRWSSGNARTLILEHTVAEIDGLLSNGYFIYEGKTKRDLAPCDIAVLVRSNAAAEEYANALADVGIPAVVTSRTSVFSSLECGELLRLLAAILAPNNLATVKGALALSWFGHDGGDMYSIVRDESRMGNWQLRLMDYARQWHTNGFFSMMGTLLQKEKVLVRLAQGMRGERRIANLRQLLTLVEEESDVRNLMPREVYQWLLRQNNGPRGMAESELLLESDREAVQIVTMHSAKGLEYGVVFCVDLWGGSDRLANEKNQILYRENHELGIDLGSKDFDVHREKAREELRAEDLRLLYVAVTRAKMRCYTVWADVKGIEGKTIDSFDSSLGYLLFPNVNAKKCDGECQRSKITALTKEEGVFMKVLAEEVNSPEFHSAGPSSAQGNLQKREFLRNDLVDFWGLSSFSSLAGFSEYAYEHSGDKEADKEEGRAIPVVSLPAGPRFGSAVHDILENCSFSSLAANDDQSLQSCRKFAAVHGFDGHAPKLAELMAQTVHTPLRDTANDNTFSLARISDDDCVKEMPFYLLHRTVTTHGICQLLSDDPAVVPLGEKKMEGYLTGFIDLVCRWKGRYYIMDYKTNHLGNSLADYREDGLLAAMRSHNYGLQYWLYTVALHRYLGRMEENYEYTRHFGGVFYLFVRGMTADSPGSGVFFTVPPSHKVQELDDLLGGNP